MRWEGVWSGDEQNAWVPITQLNKVCKKEARELERKKFKVNCVQARGSVVREEEPAGRRVSPG